MRKKSKRKKQIKLILLRQSKGKEKNKIFVKEQFYCLKNKNMKTFQAYLLNCHRTYSCVHCRAHLANHDELISKSFQGSQGRAYLFNSVVNVQCGIAEERVLLTGLHAVADIYCECCKTTLGWKYEHAFESSQKYKEGKYIIELAHMIKENGWEEENGPNINGQYPNQQQNYMNHKYSHFINKKNHFNQMGIGIGALSNNNDTGTSSNSPSCSNGSPRSSNTHQPTGILSASNHLEKRR